MRNALVKKIGIVCLIWLVTFGVGVAQKQLPVPQIGQTTDSWCWAACIEMVTKFYTPSSTVDQCSLAIVLKKFNTSLSGPEKTAINNRTYCCPTCNEGEIQMTPPGCTTSIYHNVPIPFFYGTGPTVPHFFDVIFSVIGYNSIEEVNGAYPILRTNTSDPTPERRMSWAEIVRQIEADHPFIIIFAPPSAVNSTGPVSLGRAKMPTSSHAVVAKGYSETTGVRLVYVHDPWLPLCGGSEVAIPYNVFTATADRYVVPSAIKYNFHQVLATVHSIVPKAADAVLFRRVKYVHPDTTQEGSLVSLINENAANILGAQKDDYDDGVYTSKVKDGPYYENRIRYISPTQIRRAPRNLSSVTVPNEIVEVVSTNVNPNVITTLEHLGDKWVVRRITTFSNIKRSLEVQIDANTKITLSNLKSNQAPQGAIPYQLIRYPPFIYEFYSFNYQGKPYLVPAQNYPALEMQQGNAYPERRILRQLCRQTKKYGKASTLLDIVQSATNTTKKTN